MSSKICPVCGATVEIEKFAPFCSKRCADVDLSRWLKGNYVIPGASSDSADENVSGEKLDSDAN